MGAESKISWTSTINADGSTTPGATWTPIRARVREDAAEIAQAKGYTSLVQIAEKMAGRIGPHCEHVSPGCANCYSETNNSRCLPANGTGLPFDRRSRDLVEPFVDENILTQPLRWKKPRKIFVCSQTDLFGEWVTDEMIDQVFSIMALCPQHTFQILTKRASRLLEYVGSLDKDDESMRDRIDKAAQEFGACHANMDDPERWPLPNVWLGVSVEDQATADERLPWLLKTPAAVRFLSVEPQKEPITLKCLVNKEYRHSSWTRESGQYGVDVPRETVNTVPRIDWVIQGGESGPHARPFDVQWARDMRDSCNAAGTAYWLKQLGAKPVWSRSIINKNGDKLEMSIPLKLKSRSGSNTFEWPADLQQCQEFPQ